MCEKIKARRKCGSYDSSMGCVFAELFRHHIDKLAELNNIIVGYVLSIPELKVKEANMICWYVLPKNTVRQHAKAFYVFSN